MTAQFCQCFETIICTCQKNNLVYIPHVLPYTMMVETWFVLDKVHTRTFNSTSRPCARSTLFLNFSMFEKKCKSSLCFSYLTNAAKSFSYNFSELKIFLMIKQNQRWHFFVPLHARHHVFSWVPKTDFTWGFHSFANSWSLGRGIIVADKEWKEGRERRSFIIIINTPLIVIILLYYLYIILYYVVIIMSY